MARLVSRLCSSQAPIAPSTDLIVFIPYSMKTAGIPPTILTIRQGSPATWTEYHQLLLVYTRFLKGAKFTQFASEGRWLTSGELPFGRLQSENRAFAVKERNNLLRKCTKVESLSIPPSFVIDNFIDRTNTVVDQLLNECEDSLEKWR